MKKSTAIILAIITGLIGVFIGINIQNNFNKDMILAVILLFNAILIVSTISKN